MKDFIIKYFALFYYTKIFGKVRPVMRGIAPNVTLFCIAGLYTISHDDYGFGTLDWILWGLVVLCVWVSFPLFGLGYFGISPVKYKDLKDWQQKHQYLHAPELYKWEDTSEHEFEQRRLDNRFHVRFEGDEEFINAFIYFYPWAILLITSIIAYLLLA